MPVYNSAGISPSERFSPEQLVRILNKGAKKAFYADNLSDMVDLIKQKALKGDVILIMSNGDCGGIYTLLKKAFTL